MRILICDKHPVARAGLKHALAAQIPTVDVLEVNSIEHDHGKPIPWARLYGLLDLIVCDPFPAIPRPLSGADLDPYFIAADTTPIAIFAGSEHPADIRTALAYKVAAYIPKSIELTLIGSILQLVRAGGVYVPPCLANQLHDGDPYASSYFPELPLNDGPVSLAENAPAALIGPLPQISSPSRTSDMDFAPIPSAITNLTKRQRQVLELLSQGLSNADIGNQMKLNLSTVKSHVTAVLRALGVASRTQAVLLYKQHSPLALAPRPTMERSSS